MNEQQNMKEKLEALDSIIRDNPKVAIDSLEKINKKRLSKSNTAYYSLLTTIARQKNYESFKNDSVISEAVNWYRGVKDYRNYCRSLLYKGIVIYNISQADSSAYMFVKQAEETYISRGIDDKALESTIYLYLGRISSLKEKYSDAESYFRKCMDISKEIDYLENLQNARIDLFWTFLSQKRYSDALSNIIVFADEDTLSPHIQYKFYNALAGYYSSKQDFRISTEYVKKMLAMKCTDNLEINYPKLYHSLANFYIKYNRPDSALFYGKLAVKTLKKANADNHFYYRYLADLYSQRGEYKQAFENCRLAYLSYISVYSKISQNRYMEIEKRYDLSQKEAQLRKSEADKTFLFSVVISLSLLVVLTILFFSKFVNKYNRKRESSEEKFCTAENELKRSWFINEVQKISADLLPRFIEDVNRQATRSRKHSKEISDELNKSIEDVKSSARNKLTAIVRNETFMTLNPSLKYLQDLSDLEKTIVTLIEYGYTTQDMADLLNTSTSNIRATKTKIRDKISALENLSNDTKTALKIFEKE
ncbi:MAG: hypothetical protein A2X18_01570 [Bacteroidetes bacterium GWF2_40_14]|nr:MAG: hypothetical protein A2X18_01570 [Bacteroidetes bacterium GWF2_40_14]